MVTPYRLLTCCAKILRIRNLQVSALCASVDALVRNIRLIISYLLSTLGKGCYFC